MKQFFVIAGAVLVGALAALLLYDRFVLADTFAPGGRIHLTPSVDPQSYIVNWACRIEHGDDLRRQVPGCE